MFHAGYFAASYFPSGYFPRGDIAAVEANYFPHGYFADQDFPDRYFPGQASPVSSAHPRYFAHRYFALAYYPDPYFPGQDGHEPVAPVIPSDVVGGAFPVRPSVRPVRAWLRADLAPFELDLRARLLPAAIAARIRGRLQGFEVEIEASALAAAIHAGELEARVGPFGLELHGAVQRPRRRRSSDDDELDEFYRLALDEWSR